MFYSPNLPTSRHYNKFQSKQPIKGKSYFFFNLFSLLSFVPEQNKTNNGLQPYRFLNRLIVSFIAVQIINFKVFLHGCKLPKFKLTVKFLKDLLSLSSELSLNFYSR